MSIIVSLDLIFRPIFLCFECLTFYVAEAKEAEFANSADLDEVAHNEPPHLDLHCLPISL